jgi:hypothetical protein
MGFSLVNQRTDDFKKSIMSSGAFRIMEQFGSIQTKIERRMLWRNYS